MLFARAMPRTAWILGSLLVAACAPPTEPPSDEPVSENEQRLDVKPGDPVALGLARVLAPEAGVGVFAEVLLDTGESRTLHLRTRLDETVLLVSSEPSESSGADAIESLEQAAGETTSPGAQGPCGDGAKNLLPYRIDGNLTWWFNAGSTPAANSVANVEESLKRAARNITRSKNSCGLADQVNVTQTYAGRTTVGAQIDADATCKATGNGKNSLGFGALPEGVLGLACVFYDGDGHVIEADIRLNAARDWYAQKPSSCSGRFSIEAVATHEFGHVFGLGHVAEGAHGNLTMSPQINGPCQSAEATLGRGDVLGLRAKY